MIFNRSKKGDSATDPSKELHKLKRQDLLELLLEQMRENDILRASAEDDREDITYLTDLAERQQAQLQDKDELLEGLQSRFHKLTKEMGLREREHVLLEIEDLFTTHLLAEAKMQYEDVAINATPDVKPAAATPAPATPAPASAHSSRHFATLPSIDD